MLLLVEANAFRVFEGNNGMFAPVAKTGMGS